MISMVKRIVKKLRHLLGKPNADDDLFFTKDYFKGNKYIIGEYTYGRPKVLFENNDANLRIGKYCSISTNVTIFLGGNHRIDWITTYPFNDLPAFFPEANNIIGHPATKGDVVIGNDVWIGNGATILSGVTIADGAVIAADAVVTKNVGAYEIWAGNPARLVKKRFEDSTIEKLLKLKWWNWSDEKVRENLSLLQSNKLNELK